MQCVHRRAVSFAPQFRMRRPVKRAQGEKEQELARKRLYTVISDAAYHFHEVLTQLYRDFYELELDM